jgi:hypothetical protein
MLVLMQVPVTAAASSGLLLNENDVARIRIKSISPIVESPTRITPGDFDRRTRAQIPTTVDNPSAINKCLGALENAGFARVETPIDVRYRFEFVGSKNDVVATLYCSTWGDIEVSGRQWHPVTNSAWLTDCRPSVDAKQHDSAIESRGSQIPHKGTATGQNDIRGGVADQPLAFGVIIMTLILLVGLAFAKRKHDARRD